MQLIGHLVDAGLDARLVFFAAGRAGSTGRANDIIAPP
jgi:hypothetical protein